MMETSLAPGLLLAMPQLVDPNFSRAVVLMIEHNEHGSFGLIINHPIDLSAAELLESMDLPWNGDRDTVVWSGGPVQPNSGWILHEPTADMPAREIGEDTALSPTGGSLLVCPRVALSSSPDILRRMGEAPSPHMRLILGYSGWGPGQLASEMARGSWLHADVDPALVFDTPPEEMWVQALRSLGIDPETIVKGVGIN